MKIIKSLLNYEISVGNILLIIIPLTIFYFTLPKTVRPITQEKVSNQVKIVKEIPVATTSPTTLYQVLDVVDGDTIKVLVNNQSVTLRLIGIDTPETKDPRKPVQCFAETASAKAKELLEGKQVYLEVDLSQGELDKYNRLLRYVNFSDKKSYNQFMIENGYAHEYTYNLPYKYQREYKEAEMRARNGLKGLWSPDTCGGDTKKEAVITK